MPELPEVESVRRLMERVLVGRKIQRAEVAPDEIVLGGAPPEAVVTALEGRKVSAVGRKGKYWWIELDQKPVVFGHLGMSGWIREQGGEAIRLHSHGDAPLDDGEGEPRFLKLRLTTDEGRRIVFTDGRRLARLWLGESPEADPRVAKLGPDAYESLPSPPDLHVTLVRRKAPIKALLLDQAILSGIGNWIADEVLYHARIAPHRPANTLSAEETTALHQAIQSVLHHAVECDADYTRFPENWMFHQRWGGSRGSDRVEGYEIVRETVGGRTTAWVPEVQK